MTTAFYSHPDCRGHDMGHGHPECPQRLDAIDDYLLATGLDVAIERHEAPLVDPADLTYAHGGAYVAELREVLERV
jgi:acetoin utilization deacetylase AcuC-like enzyme